MATSAELQNVQQAILRKKIVAEADLEAASGTTVAQYTEVLVERAESSTEPVLIMYDAIIGKVPTSTQLDNLAAFAQAQFDYYSSVLKVANPELGPYEALGRALSGTTGFHAQSDGKSDGQFIVDAYVKAFGITPATAQIQHFEDQISYFTNLFKGAGLSAADAALQARGAVYGQIFGLSATVEDSPLDTAAENFMRAAVTGAAIYDAPLSASQPAGPDPDVQTVDLTPNTDAGAAFSLGVGDDTFNAQVQQTAFLPIQTLNNTDNLDGGAGRDTLNAQLVNAFTVPAGLKGIEVLNIDGAPGFIVPPVTLDVVNADSLDTIGFRAPSNNVTVTNVKTVLSTVSISDQKGGLTDTINFVKPSGQTGLSGGNDELAINLSNVGQGAGAVALVLNQLTAGGGGYETLDVNSTGGIPNDFNVRGTAQTASTVNITGDTDLNINSPQADAWNVGTLHLLDASTFTANLNTDFKGTGAITVKGGSGVDDLTFHTSGTVNVSGNDGDDIIRVGDAGFTHTGGTVTVDGGAGNDSINITSDSGSNVHGGIGNDTIFYGSVGGAVTFGANDFADGGDGNDLLIIQRQSGGELLFHGAGITNIEAIRHVGNMGGADLTVDMTQTGSANVVQLDGTNYDDVTVNGLKNTQTIEVMSNMDTLTLHHGVSVIQEYHLQLDGSVVDDLVTDPVPAADGVFVSSSGISAINHVNGVTGDMAISGSGTLSIGTGGGGAYSINNGLVDASAFTGSLTFVADGGVQHIIGGSGSDTINSGSGNDLVDLSAGGNDTIIYTNFDSNANQLATNANYDLVTGWSNDTLTIDLSSIPNTVNSNNALVAANAPINELDVAQSGTFGAAGSGVNFIKFTTAVNNAGLTVQQMFNTAIGGGNVDVTDAAGNPNNYITASIYDAAHGQMILIQIDPYSDLQANDTINAGDDVDVIGMVAMSAADYAAFSGANLHFQA